MFIIAYRDMQYVDDEDSKSTIKTSGRIAPT